ncbi:lysophospholipid acyltransferase family protein [Allohahella sp. A8]|uniref:lysophospholipid acyltransferase family protein n=1 Tax=Allohahella sp. A8 TaxID=3141461 RepID=UPI000C096AA7|nr:lipid A biosynthesis acyltransferase [Hahellaceae bacterium]|tara:strand:- start:18068 stop:18976 length:909 start_codon:yes stop_codon:yes gene_type:complete
MTTHDLKGRMLSAILRKSIRLLSGLSLGSLQRIGSILGKAAVVWQTEALRITRINIEACYPHLSQVEKERLAYDSMLNTGMVAAEMAAIWEWPTARVLDLIQHVEGASLLEEAKQSREGLIVLVPHLGNWELSGLFLAHHFTIRSLYLEPKLPGMDEYMRSVRERNGSTLVPAGKRGVMSLFTSLREGGVTGILPDQSPDRSGGIFVPFFGMQTHTMKLVPRLIEKTGARVLMMTSLRNDSGGFDVHVQKPLDDIYASDLHESAAAMNASMERLIQLAPAQYQWEYKRFKHLPDKARHMYRT